MMNDECGMMIDELRANCLLPSVHHSSFRIHRFLFIPSPSVYGASAVGARVWKNAKSR